MHAYINLVLPCRTALVIRRALVAATFLAGIVISHRAPGQTLYTNFVQGFCPSTYDAVDVTVTVKVDASTPNGIKNIRMNNIGMATSAYDQFINLWVTNGIITQAGWESQGWSGSGGTGVRTSAYTFHAGSSAGTSQGGLRVYDRDNYSRRVEWPVTEGGTKTFPACPVPAPIIYHGAMTLNFAGGGPYTKPNDDKICQGCPTCGSDPGAPGPPMAIYSVHSMLASLNVRDTPLRYAPAFGPRVDFTVTYNQRDAQQPSTFGYSNLGRKWTFSWLSYVTDDPTSQLAQTALYRSGGGAEIFLYDGSTSTFKADPQSHATLVKTGSASYERRMPDGSKEVFAQSDGAQSYPRRIFMTQFVDPAGNAIDIAYDASSRVSTVTDAQGLVTTLSYELTDDPLKITKVTDPFGRFATFQYTNGQLTTITDEIGIQSVFGYAAGSDFINTLTTPYGTTNFVSGEDGTNRWIEITDPLGGKERVEYRDGAPGIASTDAVAPSASGVVNLGLAVANTFYWDKKAMLVAPGDYTKAQVKHWLYSADGSLSGILSSEKKPLENRVWYTYDGQPDYQHAGSTASPAKVARVLGDGTTQLTQYEYNALGKMTQSIDPVGRKTSYIYDASGVDLLEIRNTTGTLNHLLRSVVYNTQHQPLTDTDAAGQTTTYRYYPNGQTWTRKNAKNEERRLPTAAQHRLII